MPSANGSRTPQPAILDIAAIDDSDIVGWMASVFRLNEMYMTDVTSLVEGVKRRCAAITGGAHVRRLDVLDHGNSAGMEIGSDWITMKNVGSFDSQFRQLGSLFDKAGFVHFQHCEVGQNHTLLAHLSKVLGVPVYAGTGAHNPVYRFNFGKYERCVKDGNCESDVARP